MSDSRSFEPVVEGPSEPIHRLTAPLERFMHIEAGSGVVLLLFTATALILANSPFADSFLGFWKTRIRFGFGGFEMDHSLQHWINDGLMVVFFFVIGLEVKRELVIGELNSARKAALPIAAAFGGMVVPAAIYLSLEYGEPGEAGWGIPMATDIAFVVGCLAILGRRVPRGLRVVLLSLAIADDIGAILVIAVGYTESINWAALGLGVACIGGILALQQLGVRSILLYTIVGFVMWIGFHESGVHATVAGVILGLLTPARSYLDPSVFEDMLSGASDAILRGLDSLDHRGQRVRRFQWATREVISPLEYLENTLHPWMGFAIMPLFAFANAGVPIQPSYFTSSIAIAVALGLVVGKPLGILSFSWLAIRLGIAELPEGISWGVVTGAGFLAGIGFTMALFISGLALPEGSPLDAAKVGILVGSGIAATVGLTVLIAVLPSGRTRPEK